MSQNQDLLNEMTCPKCGHKCVPEVLTPRITMNAGQVLYDHLHDVHGFNQDQILDEVCPPLRALFPADEE